MASIISDWKPQLDGYVHGVDWLLPPRFSAFARILHPFRDAEFEPTVSWDRVTNWSGRTLHRLAQTPVISVPQGGSKGPRPSDEDEPLDGLSTDQIRHLIPHLSEATRRSDLCYFGVWDGYGDFHRGSSSMLALDNGRTGGGGGFVGNIKRLAAAALYGPPGETCVSAVPPLVSLDKKFNIPDREFFMFSGPLSIAPTFEEHVLGCYDHGLSGTEAPNVWWPADEEWMVHTDIDLTSSYVGGSDELITAILADDKLEAFRAYPTDKVSIDADVINIDSKH